MTPLAIDRTADWNDVGKNRATINCNAQSTWNNWYKGKTLFDAKDILVLNFDSGALSVQTFTRGHFFVLTAQKSSGTLRHFWAVLKLLSVRKENITTENDYYQWESLVLNSGQTFFRPSFSFLKEAFVWLFVRAILCTHALKRLLLCKTWKRAAGPCLMFIQLSNRAPVCIFKPNFYVWRNLKSVKQITDLFSISAWALIAVHQLFQIMRVILWFEAEIREMLYDLFTELLREIIG